MCNRWRPAVFGGGLLETESIWGRTNKRRHACIDHERFVLFFELFVTNDLKWYFLFFSNFWTKHTFYAVNIPIWQSRDQYIVKSDKHYASWASLNCVEPSHKIQYWGLRKSIDLSSSGCGRWDYFTMKKKKTTTILPIRTYANLKRKSSFSRTGNDFHIWKLSGLIPFPTMSNKFLDMDRWIFAQQTS